MNAPNLKAFMNKFIRLSIVAACGFGMLHTSISALAEAPAFPFGFSGKEVFPIDPQIRQLRPADLDGDGLLDIALFNPVRARIALLYNRTGRANVLSEISVEDAFGINELPPDARFEIKSLPAEISIASFDVADVNDDGRPDIMYYGEPKDLVIHYNAGGRKWENPVRIPIRDGQVNLNGLVHGDLDGDGRTDLMLLAENHFYLIAQDENNRLKEPVKVPFSGAVTGLQILDINSDDREDALLVNWNGSHPVAFRLQDDSGNLGPEIHFQMSPIRSYWADDMDSNGETEFTTISNLSGRAQVSVFLEREAERLSGEFSIGQFQTLPFNRVAKSARGVCWGDVDGDGRVDLLVAEPDNGQLTLFLQDAKGAFGSPQTFPTLSGVSHIEVADWDGDGGAEIFLLSAEENQVGVTRYEEGGRIPFPVFLKVGGKPLVMAAGVVRPGSPASLGVIVDVDNRRQFQIHSSDGERFTQELDAGFRSRPESLKLHDANQDGFEDFVVLIAYEQTKFLVQRKDESEFHEINVAPPGGNSNEPWMTTADVDGDGLEELVLAKKNFVRAVVLEQVGDSVEKDSGVWQLRVKDQINGAESESNIRGAAFFANGSTPAVFLFDSKFRQLTYCERNEAGVWQIVRNMEIPVEAIRELTPITLGGGIPSVGAIGLNAVSWMALGGDVWHFEELAGYETAERNGRLLDMVTGDLNGDERRDVVFIEDLKHNIEIVEYDPVHGLKLALKWQVFEERTFRNRNNRQSEPREAFVGDFTNDGKDDLIILVHDRVVLYPQG